jgi:hypothetical protein
MHESQGQNQRIGLWSSMNINFFRNQVTSRRLRLMWPALLSQDILRSRTFSRIIYKT